MICLPDVGDEIAIAELVNRAKPDVPIRLQAANDKVDVTSRRDAFCGKLSGTNETSVRCRPAHGRSPIG